MEVIRELFRKNGSSDYIGENITQIQHMAQTAKLAKDAKSDKNIIVACFLHDIGHLIDKDNMFNINIEYIMKNDINYGVKNHELVGAKLCKILDLPELVCDLVANHISAKRYLVSIDQDYKKTLSEASLITLEAQGGTMTIDEIIDYERNPNYKLYVQMRLWDDAAKNIKTFVSDNEIEYFYKCIDNIIN